MSSIGVRARALSFAVGMFPAAGCVLTGCLNVQLNPLDASTPQGLILTLLSAARAVPSDPLFVAVSGTGQVYYSSTGQSWTAGTSPTVAILNDVAYCDGLFVAVGGAASGVVIYSTDGKVWSLATSSLGGVALSGVACSGKRFVAVQSSQTNAYYSDDGISWTISAVGLTMRDVAFGNGRFLVVDTSGSGSESTNGGVNWGGSNLIDSNSGFLQTVTYANGLFLVGGDGSSPAGSVFTADTGTAGPWSASTPVVSASVNGLAFGNSVYVALEATGGTGDLYSSTNSTVWSLRNVGQAAQLKGIAFGNGRFVVSGAAGGNHLLTHSTDGINWTGASPGGAGTINAVAFRP